MRSRNSINPTALGHYRLWVNGIHHGDISLGNLMYDFSHETGDPVGVVNDFDLASWVNHSTTNNDRTGTIPFMAIDLLQGGLESRVPRLYRHDLESFSWVLAYVTAADIEYKNQTIKISPPPGAKVWFRDNDDEERKAHVSSKLLFHSNYGWDLAVSARYDSYFSTVKNIAQYWFQFHESRKPERILKGPKGIMTQKKSGSNHEVDDAVYFLGQFVATVGRAGSGEGFAEMKACLLDAIDTPPQQLR